MDELETRDFCRRSWLADSPLVEMTCAQCGKMFSGNRIRLLCRRCKTGTWTDNVPLTKDELIKSLAYRVASQADQLSLNAERKQTAMGSLLRLIDAYECYRDLSWFDWLFRTSNEKTSRLILNGCLTRAEAEYHERAAKCTGTVPPELEVIASVIGFVRRYMRSWCW